MCRILASPTDVVRRWDLGHAVGQEVAWTEETAFVESRLVTFGDQLDAEGICRPTLDAHEGADRQTRVPAVSGRRG